MFKQIDIQKLRPGMVIVRIVEQNGPVKIKKSGLVTSQDMVTGLIDMGVQQVEVDPDQTVEVQTPEIKKSATRRMLESNKVTHSPIDDGLSGQFNRSLFLPSAQSIPPAWQFYTKRYLFAAFIALGGLGFGMTLANYHSVLNLLSPQSNEPVVSASVPVMTSVVPVIQQPVSHVEPSPQFDKPQVATSGEVTSIPKQQVTVPDVIERLPEIIPEFIPEPKFVQTITPASEPKISADVLARFRKAMAEVDELPVTSVPVQRVPSNKDVLRIDQLPAWVMNRLPSMAFSAHMYASIESERWVRVNGSRMVEGDKVDEMVEIIRIEPQRVILNYSGHEFSMAALTDW